MKVYVVYSIPDYIGIDIEAIFLNEADAIRMVKEHNDSVKYPVFNFDYEEYEVL